MDSPLGTNDKEENTETKSETVHEKKRSSDQYSALETLSNKVEQAQTKRSIGQTAQRGRSSAIGLAYRLSIELVVGIVVGGYLGWWLDGYFGTGPLFLLIMLVLGMAAGVINMLRTSREMNARMGLDENGNESSQKEE
ncbi:MAG: AtpZ/AtpI family protein [Parvibaculales bacterium]